MYWIIQNNIANESKWSVVIDTLKRFDIEHSIHKVIPFAGELVDPPTIEHQNVICMGAYSMRHYAKKHGYNPGVFDLEPFDFTQQLAHWGDHMLNSDAEVTTFRDAVPTHERFFCRPILDSKSFAGQLFTKEDFMDWKRKIVVLGHDYGDNVGPDTMIQVCPLKTIHAEYRFFVVNGRISTASMYMLGNQIVYKNIDDIQTWQYLHDYVKSRVKEWNPIGSMCVDIAETPHGLRIVEINTLNSSGFYDIDTQKLVFDLEDAYHAKG